MLLFFCLSCLRSLAVGGEHGIGDDNTKPAIVDLFKNCLEKKKKIVWTFTTAVFPSSFV